MKVSVERGKGQIMLGEELLRMIQADREREIKAARRAREARSTAARPGGVRVWLQRRLATPSEAPPARPQTGRAATDPSA